jgi:hypothetical protein
MSRKDDTPRSRKTTQAKPQRCRPQKRVGVRLLEADRVRSYYEPELTPADFRVAEKF